MPELVDQTKYCNPEAWLCKLALAEIALKSKADTAYARSVSDYFAISLTLRSSVLGSAVFVFEPRDSILPADGLLNQQLVEPKVVAENAKWLATLNILLDEIEFLDLNTTLENFEHLPVSKAYAYLCLAIVGNRVVDIAIEEVVFYRGYIKSSQRDNDLFLLRQLALDEIDNTKILAIDGNTQQSDEALLGIVCDEGNSKGDFVCSVSWHDLE